MKKGLLHSLDARPQTVSVCLDCITDEVLRAFFEKAKPAPCAVCRGNKRDALDATYLANCARGPIRRAFDHFDEHLYPRQRGLTLQQVVAEVTSVADSAVCEFMANYLQANPRADEAGFFDTGAEYARRAGPFETEEAEREYVIGWWDGVARSLTHHQRYFNDEAERFFALLFDEAVKAKTNSLFGKLPAATKTERAGRRLYRARRIDGKGEKERILADPGGELGAPPKERAAHNRMNPPGIPMFYGAVERATCIAEVRPSIGDEIAVGVFETVRDLKLFDFRYLDVFRAPTKLSYWYDNYEKRLRCRALLFHLHNVIAQPVRAGESGYIVTQAMTEYMRHKLDGGFDGIIFRSVQAEGGSNYVIFSDRANDSEIAGLEYRPSFPVRHVGKPTFHEVKAVRYEGDWSPRGIEDTVLERPYRRNR